ncbi:MAG: hypothetical protein IKP46_00700 [Bacteroidales bacterium]|nr:hypothetical protein [Bacteroidales bacterium]
MRFRPLLLALALSSCSLWSGIGDMRCEYLEEPSCIDRPDPRLVWSSKHDYATARVSVASSRRLLKNPDVWDSGETAATKVRLDSVLVPFHKYYWRVETFDADGKRSRVSPVARFSTGLFSGSDASGEWITGETARSFRVARGLRKALLYVSAEEIPAVWINTNRRMKRGRIHEECFSPYKSLYSVIDVTGRLKKKRNRIVIHSEAPVMAELHLLYRDGSRDIVSTDRLWDGAYLSKPLAVTGAWKSGEIPSEDYLLKIERGETSDVLHLEEVALSFSDIPPFILADIIYERTGDTDLIRRFYPVFRDFLVKVAEYEKPDGTVARGTIVSWLPDREEWPSAYTATCFYYYDNLLMAKFSRILGQDGSAYLEKAAALRERILDKHFVYAEDRFSNGGADVLTLALWMGLAPEDHRDGVVKRLANQLRRGSGPDESRLGTWTAIQFCPQIKND